LLFLVVISVNAVDHGNGDDGCSLLPDPFQGGLLQTGSTGHDVLIAQQLLSRSRYVDSVTADGVFGNETETAVSAFQAGNKLAGVTRAGAIDRVTANAILAHHTHDGYKDDGRSASAQGYLFKIILPVHRNRSIETIASFLDAENKELLRFRVRTKGYVEDGCGQIQREPWPSFNNTGDGLNMFSSDGMTPTGLVEVDLNSPEDEPKLYGKWPVTRFVKGVQGNAKFLVPSIRNGILLHTGEWANWTTAEAMPDSAGCVHSWPENIVKIWKTATGPGVGAKVRPNTSGKVPYPYKPQGIASVFLVG